MKKLVRENFSRAVSTYSQFGKTQHQVATDFAARLSQLEAPTSILEIGCGTGFLSQYLSTYKCPLILSDLSPQMVANLPPHPGLSVAFDGEHLPFKICFDWIVSSLAFQWFETPHNTLSDLKRQCHTLAFTTLGANNFYEWKEFCQHHNIENRMPKMLSLDDLKKILGPKVHIAEAYYPEKHPHWLSFWNNIYHIGANTPLPQKKDPLAKSLLQRGPITCSYHVLTVISS